MSAMGAPWVTWAVGRWSSGVKFQEGWVVVRTGWVAFLPTHAAANLLVELGLALMPVQQVAGRPQGYELGALADLGPDAFDREVQRNATHLWRAEETSLAIGVQSRGTVAVTFWRGDSEQLATSFPMDAEPSLFARYSVRVPGRRAVHRQLREIFLASLVPAALLAISLIAGFVTREPRAWAWASALLCWSPLTLLLWGVIVVRHHRARELPLETGLRPLTAADLPFAASSGTSTRIRSAGPETSPEAASGSGMLYVRVVMAHASELVGISLAFVFLAAMLERAIGPHPAMPLLTLALPVLGLLYYAAFTSWMGGTPLLRMLGVRIVPDGGGRTATPAFVRALARGLLMLLSLFAIGACFPFGPIALFLYSKKRGRPPWDDLTATRAIWA